MDMNRKETSTPVPTNQSPVVVKKRRSAWSTVAFLFMLLLLASLAMGAWLWYMWQDSKNQQATLRSDVSSAQAAMANLREQIGVKNGQAAAEANQPVNDETAIISAVKAYNSALGTPINDVKIQVTKRDGNIAIANVSNVTAGYKAYLKKSGNIWLVVWSGQNTPPDEVVKLFGL